MEHAPLNLPHPNCAPSFGIMGATASLFRWVPWTMLPPSIWHPVFAALLYFVSGRRLIIPIPWITLSLPTLHSSATTRRRRRTLSPPTVRRRGFWSCLTGLPIGKTNAAESHLTPKECLPTPTSFHLDGPSIGKQRRIRCLHPQRQNYPGSTQ